MPTGEKKLSRAGCASWNGDIAELKAEIHCRESGYEVYKGQTNSVDFIIRDTSTNEMLGVEVKTGKGFGHGAIGYVEPRWLKDREAPGRQWDLLMIVERDDSITVYDSKLNRVDLSCITDTQAA